MGCLLKQGGIHSRLRIGAVLLAAGEGRRMGRVAKPLIRLQGVPLISRQLVALSGAGVDEVVVVTGYARRAIEDELRSFVVTLAHNEAFAGGQQSSVRVGLAALSGPFDAVIVALADQPLIGEQDIVDLIGAFKKRGDAAMVVPRVAADGGEALPGNPVIFDAALREEWLAGSADLACRNWRRRHPERVRWFDTTNRRYRIDIDTPEDLAQFASSTGHRLQWPASLQREVAE